MKIGKINRISIANTAYVSPLETIPSPPSELFIAGQLPQERRPTVAIIGTRKPTSYGKELANQFASALARRGVIVISGLAYGIDSIAHQAALDAGGTTIAVMANGLHRIYPAVHTRLAEAIVHQGGAVVSERQLGYDARKFDFLARNRLISGLSDAILIPEATERSGTMSTVTHALEQGREVFAIPGPVTSLTSAGTNSLIQQGALIALRPEDIIERLIPSTATEHQQLTLIAGDTPLETLLLQKIQQGITSGDTLAAESGVPISEFLQTLSLLEIKGAIRPLGANHWTCKRR